MIRRVSANFESFRTVDFRAGFNLVLAERSEGSTDRDSRNGLGKSVLLEILHFCLGAQGAAGKGIVVDALREWTFRVDIRHGERDFALSRAIESGQKRWTYIDSRVGNWPIDPQVHDGRARMSQPDLRKLLGRIQYGLNEEIEDTKWGPTFRSLLAYQIRRDPDGFLDPFTQWRQQKEWDRQVNVTYQLDLNWQDAVEFQEIRSQKSVIDQLNKALREGALPDSLGSEGALETERVRLAGLIGDRLERLSKFEVRDDYSEIEDEVNALSERAHLLVNENIRDRRFADLYESQFDGERQMAISEDQVEALFAEAQIELPDHVTRRLAEVKAFHSAVVANREKYLESEIERLRSAIEERDNLVAEIDSRKSDLMEVLSSTGALDEYTKLQELLEEMRGRLHDVESRLKRLREMENALSEWEIRKSSALRGARTRYEELQTQRDRAIKLFNSNTEALYESPGRLIIDITESGFKFEVDIERADSHGVSNMKIFCFDLMMMQLWAERGGGPGFLVHDSALFDGVDERQKAAALELACAESERLGFQYICSMNSDDLPREELDDESPVLDAIVLELHDRDVSGRLLGIEF
jgi:uncharacterized protein YydD (DUF2326 family)